MYFVSAYLVSIVALKEHLKISSTKISDYVQGKQEKSSKLHTNIFVPKGIFPSLPLINLSCTYVLLCEVIGKVCQWPHFLTNRLAEEDSFAVERLKLMAKIATQDPPTSARPENSEPDNPGTDSVVVLDDSTNRGESRGRTKELEVYKEFERISNIADWMSDIAPVSHLRITVDKLCE